MPTPQKWLSLLGGTATAMLLNLLWLTPIRYYSLLRLRDTRWHDR